MNEGKAYYTFTGNEAVSALNSNVQHGLSTEEAEARLENYGRNEISNIARIRPILILLKQFNNAMSYLLFFAAGVSFFLQEWPDGIAIVVVILVNSAIGFGMEFQAARSMEALKRMVSVFSKVVRNGSVLEIPSTSIVPGDILHLEAGDMITADARIIEAIRLETNESVLTGESMPVEKRSEEMPEDTILADRVNMVYRGTFATKGNCRAVVAATGMQTELGNIARIVQTTKRDRTPLEMKLQAFSTRLIIITLVLVVVIFLAGLINKANWLEILQTAIALAVAAIPEGLPIVATLALANGMIKMARHNVIVKKLAAVETLGSTDTICTDKTGTLTQNRIEVEVLEFPGSSMNVFTMKGPISPSVSDDFDGKLLLGEDNAVRLLKIGVLCSTAEYLNITTDEGMREQAVGDPLEVGLLRYAVSAGVDISELRSSHPKTGEIPFDPEIKLMATRHRHGDEHVVTVKGAAEAILEHCTMLKTRGNPEDLTTEQREFWLERADQLALKGLRVLAFAWKEEDDEDMLAGLTFAGIVGFMDAPAPGVKEAISKCRQAGINVVMITGDHPSTALTIARDLGLTDEMDTNVINGKDMTAYEDLGEEEKKNWLKSKVFARVNPSQKLGLISVFQEGGHIVGMTGDGVNDAPALTKSNIGIAMGIRGTQVAQQAADMVLEDDSFQSIVSAVKQGRIIFDNIRKFVIFLLSCNLSELLIVSTIAILGFPFQLVPLQILFINLITDVLPAMALGLSKGSPGVMLRKPKLPDEPIITRKQWRSIWIYAAVICLFTMAAVLIRLYAMPSDVGQAGAELLNNIVFFSLIFSQLFHVFNMAEQRSGIFQNEVVHNKFLWYALAACGIIVTLGFVIGPVRNVLHIHTLERVDWLIVMGCALLSMVINRLLKIINVVE